MKPKKIKIVPVELSVREFAKLKDKTTSWVYNVYLKANPDKGTKRGPYQFILVDPSEIPAPAAETVEQPKTN